MPYYYKGGAKFSKSLHCYYSNGQGLLPLWGKLYTKDSAGLDVIDFTSISKDEFYPITEQYRAITFAEFDENMLVELGVITNHELKQLLIIKEQLPEKLKTRKIAVVPEAERPTPPKRKLRAKKNLPKSKHSRITFIDDSLDELSFSDDDDDGYGGSGGLNDDDDYNEETPYSSFASSKVYKRKHNDQVIISSTNQCSAEDGQFSCNTDPEITIEEPPSDTEEEIMAAGVPFCIPVDNITTKPAEKINPLEITSNTTFTVPLSIAEINLRKTYGPNFNNCQPKSRDITFMLKDGSFSGNRCNFESDCEVLETLNLLSISCSTFILFMDYIHLGKFNFEPNIDLLDEYFSLLELTNYHIEFPKVFWKDMDRKITEQVPAKEIFFYRAYKVISRGIDIELKNIIKAQLFSCYKILSTDSLLWFQLDEEILVELLQTEHFVDNLAIDVYHVMKRIVGWYIHKYYEGLTKNLQESENIYYQPNLLANSGGFLITDKPSTNTITKNQVREIMWHIKNPMLNSIDWSAIVVSSLCNHRDDGFNILTDGELWRIYRLADARKSKQKKNNDGVFSSKSPTRSYESQWDFILNTIK